MAAERTWNRMSLVLALVLAAGIIAGIIVPAGPGWDFANFYDAGHKMLVGQTRDLYNDSALIEGQPPQGHMAYYGAPVTAWLFAPMAMLQPPAAMVAFKIEGTAALLLGLWLLYRHYLPSAEKSGLGRARYRAAFLATALLFQPFWTIYRVGGQTTPTLFLGFVLALIWVADGRIFAAAAVLVAVLAVKPAFVLALIPLLLFAGLRFFACLSAAGLAAGALSVLTMGWSIHERFLQFLSIGKISPWVYNSSISVVVESFRDRIYALTYAGAALRLIAAALVFAVLFRARREIAGTKRGKQFLFFAACVTGLLLMPIVWEHYLSVLFLPVAFLAARLPLLSKPERALLAAICLLCCTQNLIFVLWLFAQLKDAGPAVQIAASLWKSAPLMLATVLICRYWTRFLEPEEQFERPRSAAGPSHKLALAGKS